MIFTMLRISERLSVPESELHFTFVSSGGPGGQNVNKRSTKAVLRWNLRTAATIPQDVRGRFIARFGSRLTRDGEIVLTSERHRDQSGNRTDCLEKLGEMLRAVEHAPRPRRRTKPKPSAVERRLEGKKRRAATKKLRHAPEDGEL